MFQVNRRVRALATLATASVLVSTAGLVTGLSASSALPIPVPGDCAEAYPVADLVDGAPVTGLTVAKGTTPAPFTGEVLGVINDGIAPGLDMVMVDLTSPDIDRVKSIWAGMSGSPVYAADGRLIGAVSYGLTWGPSQIAGVTPFESMNEYAAAPISPRAKVSVSKAEAKSLAHQSEVSTAQAAQGFKRLSVPMTVTGADPSRLAKVAKRSYLRSPLAGISGAPSVAAGPETIVAGGNLGASVAHGLVSYAGVGTTTSVCGTSVIGFGHPLAYLGETSATMHPADAIFVQADPVGTSFKVANLGAPVGVIDNDRRAAISGNLGAAPTGTVINSTSTFGTRTRSGTTTVTVPAFLAEASWLHLAGLNDRVVDGSARGDALQTWSIKGTGANGTPFDLTRTDRYWAYGDLSYEGAGEVPDIAYWLTELDGVSITSIDATSTLTKDSDMLRVRGLQRRSKGTWVDVQRRLQVKAGKTLKLRTVLSGAGVTQYRTLAVKVPRRLKGATQVLYVRGGASHFADGKTNSLAGVKAYVANSVRNDSVVATLEGEGRNAPRIQVVSALTSQVVAGQKMVRVRIR